MKIINLVALSFFLFLISCNQRKDSDDLVIAKGYMPNIATDINNNIHIVYGSGDSIMYISSKDGISFSPALLVAVIPKLMASSMRGPQIAATGNDLVVTVCTENGNIFSYKKESSGNWTKGTRVNDTDESAKEGLMALSADGENAYAIWLSVKNPEGQEVYGARSVGGGKTWSKNILVYSSPDSSVCECCKPSVAVKGNNVYVMFRNWLNKNRDMYVIKSGDSGSSFGQAIKLGTGSWQLNGCPMDGGGLAINKEGTPETVWRRKGKIYAATPGKPEKEVGEGRNCSIEIVDNKNIYAWAENGYVIVMKPDGKKVNLGKGSLPLIKALNSKVVMCLWENEKDIHTSILKL